jgi:hypothetical protein
MSASTDAAPVQVRPQRGVVYVALGDDFVREAQVSAASLKQQHPDLPVTLFTDAPVAPGPFDTVMPITPPPQTLAERKLAKIHCLAQSPYAQTLALDSDTFVCGNILDLFELLTDFDLVARHDISHYYRHELPLLGDTMQHLPASFPQPNGGMLVFRKAPAVDAFFKLWRELFQRDQHKATLAGSVLTVGDQGSCREALARSSLRIWIVPAEYDCLFNLPGYLFGPVKILHGRHRNLAAVAAFLNRRPENRVHMRLYGYVWLATVDGQIRGLRTPPNLVAKAGPLRRLWLAVDNTLYWHGLGGVVRGAASEIRRRLTTRSQAGP